MRKALNSASRYDSLTEHSNDNCYRIHNGRRISGGIKVDTRRLRKLDSSVFRRRHNRCLRLISMGSDAGTLICSEPLANTDSGSYRERAATRARRPAGAAAKSCTAKVERPACNRGGTQRTRSSSKHTKKRNVQFRQRLHVRWAHTARWALPADKAERTAEACRPPHPQIMTGRLLVLRCTTGANRR